MLLTLLGLIDPTALLLLPWQVGAGIACTVICTGLFIWAQIRHNRDEDSRKRCEERADRSTAQVEQFLQTLAKIAADTAKISQDVTAMAADNADMLHEIMQDQKVLATNQLNITNGTQQLLRDMLAMVRDVN